MHSDALREHYLSGNANVTIVANSELRELLEGEEVYIRIECSSDTPIYEPNEHRSIRPNIRLFRGSEQLSNLMSLPFEEGLNFFGQPEREKRLHWSLRVQINGGFYDSTQLMGYRHLTPGDYSGFFDRGVTSNRFRFKVVGVPDSLRERWSRYQTVAYMAQEYISLPSPGKALDSARAAAQEYLRQPSYYPWRQTGLKHCLTIFGAKRDWWRASDSLLCVTILRELACTGNEDASSIPSKILWTLLKSKDREYQDQNLISLTEQIAPGPAVQEARRIVQRNIEYNERRRRFEKRTSHPDDQD